MKANFLQVLASPRKTLPSIALSLLPLLALAGCSGSDGATGPAGPQGPPGDGSGTSTQVAEGQDAPGIHVAIVSLGGASGVNGAFQVGDHIAVTFSVTKTDGTDWDLAEMNYGRILASGPTFNYQRILAEKTDVATAAVDNGDGTFTYTFADAIPADYLAPLNDSTAFGANDGELTGTALLAGTYTVGMYFGWNYSVGTESFRDAGDTTQDFMFGAATQLEPREEVKQENCNACHMSLRVHGDLRRGVKLCVLCHTAGAEDKNDAGTLGGSPGVSIDFKVMIHKIHNGAHLPSVLGITSQDSGAIDYTATPVAYQIVGFQDAISDFSDVHFPVWPNFNVAMPKDANYSTLSATDPDGSGPLLSPKARNDATRTGVTYCLKCHGDPDGAGPLTAPAQGDMYKTQPSEQACGSCHDDVRWGHLYTSNLQSMPETADNSNCVLCHTVPPTQGDGSLLVENAHRHPLLDATLNPGVNVDVTAVTGGTGANGNFQVGDTPTLEFSITKDDGSDLGLATLDSCSAFFMGPSTNQQLVMPLTSANGMSLNPFDFVGRLQAVSSSNKGTMSKTFFGTVDETLTVEFTSTTAFNVTGSVSGALGAGTLPAAASTNPTGGAVSNFEFGPGLVANGTVQVTFSDATHFTVSGAATGSGELPNGTNASTRFSSTDLSFNIAVTTTPFAATNAIQIGLFRGGAANPVLFAVVAGKTAFSVAAGAPDRFYYEVRADAPSYTVKMPMDMQLEYLGAGSGATGQVLHSGNVPVYYGRQQLWEATTTATTTTTSAATAALDRGVDVVGATGFAAGDTVVVEPAGAVGAREYVTITPAKADGTGAASGDTTTHIYFRTPLRYAHASGVSVTKVSLALKQEGASNAYVLTPGDSTPGSALITSNVAFNAAAGMVLTYRTDARFGYKRHYLDAVQSNYVSPANNNGTIGAEQGNWKGLSYQDGTYEADIWLQKNLDLDVQNEVQTYRCTSTAGQGQFLYGAATEIQPHEIISNTDTCLSCHNDVMFHGGGRRGINTCLTCHSISGNTSNLLQPSADPIEFRQMLHKIHMGETLPDAATYQFATEGEFPAMPGGPEQCIKCHGNDSWKAPAARAHASASVPVRIWGDACGSCHDSDAATAHISVQTSLSGYESCEVCHGAGRDWAVEVMHHAH